MRKRLLAAIAAVLLAVAPVSAAEPNVGEHIHVEVANHPVDGKPIPRAPWTFQLKVQVHDATGAVTSVRVSDGSTVKKTVALNVQPPNGVVTLPFVVDFSTWPVGRHELRWTANEPKNDKGLRLYQSTGWEICIESCTPNLTSGRGSYPDAPFIEVRGWQSDYANVRILTALKNLTPGAKFVAQAANTAKTGQCFLNPDFHNLSHGLPIGSFTTSKTTLTIPATAVPGDKLVCLATQGTRTGVLRLFVQEPGSDPAVFTGESQNWWTPGGLVLP